MRLFLPLALLLLLSACSKPEAPETDPDAALASSRNVPVEVQVLAPGDFDDVLDVTGVSEAFEDAVLSAQSSGTVLTLLPLGASVSAGQVVAQLDDALPQAAIQQAEALVAQARAQADLAEDTFRRQQGLFRDSIISALEFENTRTQRIASEASVRQAEASLAQARAQARFSRITAPFSGRVEEHSVQRGEQVNPGMPVVRIVSANRLKVVVGVPERFSGDIRVGDQVQVAFSVLQGDAPRPARVSFVGNAVNPQSRTFTVELELSNPDGRIKPAMVANVLLTRARLTNVLVVPRESILRDERGESVFVVAQTEMGDIAQRRRIRTGASFGGRVVVEDGLSAGDRLVVLGQTNVSDGDLVNVARTVTAVLQ